MQILNTIHMATSTFGYFYSNAQYHAKQIAVAHEHAKGHLETGTNKPQERLLLSLLLVFFGLALTQIDRNNSIQTRKDQSQP